MTARRQTTRRRTITLAAAAVASLALGACGTSDDEQGAGQSESQEASSSEEAFREGLALPLGGVTYNVFITRQLNLADSEDADYVELDDAPPGETYYGVFIQVCNASAEPQQTASTMRVEDTLGNRFEPLDISDSIFAYQPRELEPRECTPERGSIPDMAPAGGALLVFQVPLETIENRPLELQILKGYDAESRGPGQLNIELDI